MNLAQQPFGRNRAHGRAVQKLHAFWRKLAVSAEPFHNIRAFRIWTVF